MPQGPTRRRADYAARTAQGETFKVRRALSEPLVIDGALGEGGGQLLRQALALSAGLGRAIRIDTIRAGRKKPGLLRRHLTAVRAAARICGAEVEGDAIGSQSLVFSPGPIVAGEHHFAVGGGKSAVLLLQTLVPPLLPASGRSGVTVEGSTHAPDSPSFENIARTWAPLLSSMGPRVTVTLEHHGFYPAAGGRLQAVIEPAPLKGLRAVERGALKAKRATAIVAHLDPNIGQRELATLQQMLTWDEGALSISKVTESAGPGNALIVEVESEHITEVFTGVGERSVRAEVVAEAVADAVRDYLAAEVPVARHTASQLIVPMALAGAGAICTLPLNRHARGAIDLVHLFTNLEVAVANIRGQWHVEI